MIGPLSAMIMAFTRLVLRAALCIVGMAAVRKVVSKDVAIDMKCLIWCWARKPASCY